MQIRYSIPLAVHDILNDHDRLGFDYTQQAAQAILTHDDYAERWDFESINPIDAAVIERWKMNVLINQL